MVSHLFHPFSLLFCVASLSLSRDTSLYEVEPILPLVMAQSSCFSPPSSIPRAVAAAAADADDDDDDHHHDGGGDDDDADADAVADADADATMIRL